MSANARDPDITQVKTNLALLADSTNLDAMSQSAPFLLTQEYINRVGLLPTDDGKWCLLVEDCHHVFETEKLALQAHAMFLEGVTVR